MIEEFTLTETTIDKIYRTKPKQIYETLYCNKCQKKLKVDASYISSPEQLTTLKEKWLQSHECQTQTSPELLSAFNDIYFKLPKAERILPICPLNGSDRVYSWADIRITTLENLPIAEQMIKKLIELNII